MYGVEWLILLGVVGLVVGAVVGYLLATRGNGGKRQLEADLAASRAELQNYRESVVTEFSATARKFQALNDAYTDLHRQLAHSSQALCGDITGPLLEAPVGHQDVIPADVRERIQSGRSPVGDGEAAVDPYEDDAEIRVPEPGTAAAALAAAKSASAGEAAPESTAMEADGAEGPGTKRASEATEPRADTKPGAATPETAPAANESKGAASETADAASESTDAANESTEAASKSPDAAGESPASPERKAAG